jgi:hypothetical protein
VIPKICDFRQSIEAVRKCIASQPNAKAIVDSGKALKAKLTTIEEALYQIKNQSKQDPLNYPIRLKNKLAALGSSIGSADSAPTDQALQVYADLSSRIDAELRKLEQTVKTDLPAFNQAVRSLEIPAIVVKSPAEK